MEDFIEKITAKVGISEDQAKQVYEFLQDHAHKVPEWLDSESVQQIKDKLPGGLGKLF